MSDDETIPTDNNTTSEEYAAQNAIDCEQRDTTPGGDKGHVPVSEVKRYRKRAQAAETILADLKGELQDKDAALSEQQDLISNLQRQRGIDELLTEAGAIDLETTRLLTELSISEVTEPDIVQAVEELRRSKPFLFRRTDRGTGAMSPRAAGVSREEDNLQTAAVDACVSGNRRDLLHYLRLRRRR